MLWKRRKREKDNIVLNVKHSDNKETYKNNIITGLYKNGIILKKIEGIFQRHKIPWEAQLEEDLNQIVFLELCKKPADEIIEMYEDDPSRLVGIGVRIAVLKGVAENGSLHPNTNFTKSVLFLSRLNKNNTQQAEDTALEFLLDEDTEDDEWKRNFDNLNNYLNELSDEAKETLTEIQEHQESQEKADRRFSIDKYYRKRTTDKRKVGTLLIETNIIVKDKIKNKPMEKQNLINEIEQVLPVIREYHKTRKVGHLTTENIIDIKRIWDNYINPASRLMTSCSSCIKDAMDIMESFYSANKPKAVEEPKEEPTKLTFEGVIENATPVEPETGLEEVKAFSKKEETISATAVKKVNGRQKAKK